MRKLSFGTALGFLCLIALGGCSGEAPNSVPNDGGDGGNGDGPPAANAGSVRIRAGVLSGSGNIDGVGSAARFYSLSGVVVDSAGNIFVSEVFSHTIRKISPGREVTVFAGMRSEPGTADGPQGGFSTLWAIAIDAAGNLLVIDGYAIRKITPSGVVSTLAGQVGSSGSVNGNGTQARFNQPMGLAADSAGNVFVADTDNHTIRKISPTGVVSTLAGSAGNPGSADGTGASARFRSPAGVTVDNAGNVYVADRLNYTIRKITPGGKVSTIAGQAGVRGTANGPTGTFDGPNRLTLDPAGDLLVADNAWIRKVSPAGVSTLVDRFAQASADGAAIHVQLSNLQGVAIDPSGNLVVADGGNQTIWKIDAAKAMTTVAGAPDSDIAVDGPAAQARFAKASDLAMDGNGTIYVTDWWSNTVRKVAPGGTVETVAGVRGLNSGLPHSKDGRGSQATFGVYGPNAIAADRTGNLFVIDYNSLRTINPAGDVTTLAGAAAIQGSTDGPGASARFYEPLGVAVDNAGTIYVSDTYNHTIRKVTAQGVVSTLAGVPGQSGDGDGTVSTARFDQPHGLTVDSDGNVLVADYGNQAVRKVTPSGVVTTLARWRNSTVRVVIGARGDVFVAGGYYVGKVMADGTIAEVAGIRDQFGVRPGPLPTSLNEIRGMAATADGNLVILSENAVLDLIFP